MVFYAFFMTRIPYCGMAFFATSCVARRIVTAAVFLSVSWAADKSQATALSMRQFKQLCEKAKSPEEFRQLAIFADQQASENRTKAAECQTELNAYTSGAVPYPTVPKSPTRVQTLHNLIVHYRKIEKHWTALKHQFSEKAAREANRHPGHASEHS